jgi:diaminopimelate decarboxylase
MVVISVDTISSLRKLEALYEVLPANAPRRQRVKFAIRLNTNYILNPQVETFGANPSRFGTVPTASNIRLFLERGVVPFAGFHSHHGSESNSKKDYVAVAKYIAALVKELELDPSQLWLNMGGGLHGILKDSTALKVNDADGLVQSISSLVHGLKDALPHGVSLVLEPGRLLSVNAGFGCTKVKAAKHDWWNTDSGRKKCEACVFHLYTLDMSQFLHLTWDMPFLPPPSNQTEPRVTAVLRGATSGEKDKFGAHETRVRHVGDTIVLAGLSGYSYALNNDFNGVPRVLIEFFSKHGKVLEVPRWTHKENNTKY